MKEFRQIHVIMSLMLTLGCAPVSGYPNGRVDDACDNMTPSHAGTSPQSGPSPYTISVSAATYTPGSTLTVTVSGASSGADRNFRGFFIQARTVSGGRIGTFTTANSNQQTICSNQAVSHTGRDDKPSVTVTWNAPTAASGDIRFHVTVVQTYSTFWVNRQSAIVQDPSGATAPPTTTTTTAAPVTIDAIDLGACGDTKGCFTIPLDCRNAADCDALVTWTPPSDGENNVLFEMQTKGNAWVALGLSDDKDMGGDYVLMCQNAGGLSVRSTYNNPRSNQPFENPSYGLSNISASDEDGALTCIVRRDISASNSSGDSDNDRFLSLKNGYILFLAQGGTAGDQHEDIPAISDRNVDLTKDAIRVGSSSALIKAHALLMIGAWMFLISISLLLARFYKPAFPEKTLCKVKIWFAFHRALNVVAVLMTVAGFVIIFVEVEGYTETGLDPSYLNGHPVLGIIVTALAILNPLMALCRPHPDEPRRPVFNWAHWGVGTVAHIASFVTIFFGFDMPKSQAFIDDAGREWIRKVFGGFIGWHVLTYLILEVDAIISSRRNKEAKIMKELEMKMPGYKTMETREAPSQEYSVIPYIMLFFYVPGTMAFYAAILYGIISA